LANTIRAVDDPDRYGSRWVESYVRSGVPSVVRSVARAADPVLRRRGTVGRTFVSQLPYLSRTLEPQRDLWGRLITFTVLGEGLVGGVAKVASPISVSPVSTDPVDREMGQLGMTPSMPEKVIERGGKRLKLTYPQYDRFTKESGEPAYKRVQRIIERQDYAGWSNDTKRKAINRAISQERAKVRNRLWREFKAQAKVKERKAILP
ncbi:unnamed protein product, partial [marine sediment metagenome]